MDAMLGVHAAHTYKFYIILSPSGAYYAGGLAPVDIYVEDKYVRAVRGGIGFEMCIRDRIYCAPTSPTKTSSPCAWRPSTPRPSRRTSLP